MPGTADSEAQQGHTPHVLGRLLIPPPLLPPSLPRPDKNTLDQQLGKSDFVELRRADLERYLRKLAAHPVVGASEVGRGGVGACWLAEVVCWAPHMRHRVEGCQKSGMPAVLPHTHPSCWMTLTPAVAYTHPCWLTPSPASRCAPTPQELRVFLEAEGSLATSLAWQQLQPSRGTLVEGIARLPRQLIGGPHFLCACGRNLHWVGRHAVSVTC